MDGFPKHLHFPSTEASESTHRIRKIDFQSSETVNSVNSFNSFNSVNKVNSVNSVSSVSSIQRGVDGIFLVTSVSILIIFPEVISGRRPYHESDGQRSKSVPAGVCTACTTILILLFGQITCVDYDNGLFSVRWCVMLVIQSALNVNNIP